MAAIAGLLAVGVSAFVYIEGRSEQTKKLDMELIGRSTLVDTTVSGVAKGIEVVYAGRKIANYSILQVRVANVGGQPIRSSDYEAPVEIGVQNVAEVLSADQSSASAEGLTSSPTISGNNVRLTPALLNPGDWMIFVVGVVPLEGAVPTIKPQGRIAGVKQIEFIDVSEAGKTKERGSMVLRAISVFQSILVLAMVFLQFWFMKRRRSI